MSPIKLIAQLFRVTTNADGGGKLTLEFGADSLEAIHQIQKLNGAGQINLAVVVVPFDDTPKHSPEFETPFSEWVQNLDALISK